MSEPSVQERYAPQSICFGCGPANDKGLRIRLDNVPFDALVAWLARLSQSHGVRVESAEIEAAGEVGLVNAGLLLKAG